MNGKGVKVTFKKIGEPISTIEGVVRNLIPNHHIEIAESVYAKSWQSIGFYGANVGIVEINLKNGENQGVRFPDDPTRVYYNRAIGSAYSGNSGLSSAQIEELRKTALWDSPSGD